MQNLKFYVKIDLIRAKIFPIQGTKFSKQRHDKSLQQKGQFSSRVGTCASSGLTGTHPVVT